MVIESVKVSCVCDVPFSFCHPSRCIFLVLPPIHYCNLPAYKYSTVGKINLCPLTIAGVYPRLVYCLHRSVVQKTKDKYDTGAAMDGDDDDDDADR